MKVAVVSPPLLSHNQDFFSSGIPYFPIGAAYLASTLREKGFEVSVVDAFGEAFNKIRDYKKKALIQGLKPEEVVKKIPSDVDWICFYAPLVTSHPLNLELIPVVKKAFPKAKTLVFENSQQVYAYALKEVYKEFLDLGVDFVVMGEPEERVVEVLNGKHSSDGLAFVREGKQVLVPKKIFSVIKELDALPYPAFDLFPLKNYWRMGYSHAPFSGKYVPMLSSRGCPYGCKFCVIPATNQRLWRFRSAKSIVDEMQYWKEKLGVTDFHWMDLNPTVRKDRMIEMSKLILERGLKITFKFATGTKIETFDAETLEWMAKAGCVYISFSPESGSPRVLKLMDKPFSHEHALKMTRRMNELRVYSQACFVLGFPGETKDDLKQSWNYLKELTKAGLDEASLFIEAPVPGAEATPSLPGEVTDLADVTFSPTFRPDFKSLSSFRNNLYNHFFYWKLRYYPLKVLKSFFNVLRRRFDIKMEMTFWRLLKVKFLYRL
ncbi:MAG: radical SAM protein [Candidatus Micrarchaeota archaeon]